MWSKILKIAWYEDINSRICWQSNGFAKILVYARG
jgi:hypothetical protein